jgi:hypothetical protein
MHEQTGQKTSPQAAQPGWLPLCVVFDAQRQSGILHHMLGQLLGTAQGTGVA